MLYSHSVKYPIFETACHFGGFFYVSHFQQPAKKTKTAIDPGGQWMANGNTINSSLWKWIAGLSTSVIGLILAFAVSVAKDAQISIEVAKQHGQELLLIRGEIEGLRKEITARTHSRYTSEDAARDFRLVEFRFERNEQNIQQCMDFIKNRNSAQRQMLKVNEIGENFTTAGDVRNGHE